MEDENAWAIDVDPAGRAVITAHTLSTETSLPVAVGPDLSHNGKTDAFVAKVKTDGSALDYCGYIGGDKEEAGEGIAVLDAERIFIAGATYSGETTFPVLTGPELIYDGDMDAFVTRLSYTTLEADTASLSQSTGGVVNFELYAGMAGANRSYLLVASLSGSQPGTPLPGGLVVLPLNRDWLTDFVLSHMGLPHFSGFSGSLDTTGSATARLDTRGPVNPYFLGKTLTFAFATTSPWDFASNAVNVDVLP